MIPKKRIAIVGSGIAGLAAAHRVVELTGDQVDLALFERNPKPGGVLETVHENGFQIEQSVDNFITTLPWGLSLCERLGISDRLVHTDPRYRQTYVVAKGRLCKLPDGFMMMAPTRTWPLAITPILSPWGKLRAAMEYFIPPKKGEEDESMATFGKRRLGREAFERLVGTTRQRRLRRRYGNAFRQRDPTSFPRDGTRLRQPRTRDAKTRGPAAKAGEERSSLRTKRRAGTGCSSPCVPEFAR